MSDFLSLLIGTCSGVFAWLTLAPLLWHYCDSWCVRTRLVSPTSSGSMGLLPRVTTADFLNTVARALRSGEPPAHAIASAPAPSAAIINVQHDLRTGSSLSSALGRAEPDVVLLRSCMHLGSLSASALEHAATVERRAQQLGAEARVAASAATHSLRLLTRMPIAFVCLAWSVSPGVRHMMHTPAGLAVAATGLLMNRAGSRWLARITSDASQGVPGAPQAEHLCASMAAHLRAGGSVDSAIAMLATSNPACATSAHLLTAGEPLDRALAPLDSSCPQLRHALLAAHRDGLPLAPAVEALAVEIAVASAREARARIARVPVKATAPLVFCVLPSFLLLAVAPLILAMVGGLAHTSVA